MENLPQYYTVLFNAVTDALHLLEKGDVGSAKGMLIWGQQQAEEASVRGEEEFAEALLRYHRGITFLSGNTITPLIFNAFRKVNLEFWRGYIRGAGTGRCLETLRRFTDYIERGEGRAAAELLREGLAQFRESI